MARTEARRSIRSELLVVLLASVAATWIATAIVSYVDARHELDELLDAHLAQSASLLVAQAGREADEIDVEHSPQLHRYGRRVAFQFWENGTVLRLHSANAPNARLSSKLEGFSDADIEGQHWRVFSGWDADRRYVVQVGERRDARDEIVAKIAKNLLWPLGVALPALGLLIWLGINRATRPLRLLNREVGQRAPDNLAALELGDAPAEVAPLVVSLNRLFARVATSMENERRFTADAAHELRTPLAALRAQWEVAQLAANDAERAQAHARIGEGIDRLSRLVSQLLALASAESGGRPVHTEAVDWHRVLEKALSDCLPLLDGTGTEVTVSWPEQGAPLPLAGDEALLATLVRNLVDNALRYSPPRSLVAVRFTADSLVIEDQGTGLAEADLARLGDRFYRPAGQAQSGSGLGISIVRRVAELHGLDVRFENRGDGRGLRVTVTRPDAAAR